MPVPRGTVRFEDNSLDDRSVVFLDAHDITIQDAKGYRINRVHAEYQFESTEAREMFLLKVRERELLGRYFARAVIWQNGKVITQEKVIRIWKKVFDASGGISPAPRPGGPRERVTVSFLGRTQQYFELPLGDFKRNPMQDGPGNNRITIERLSDSRGIVFEFDPPKHRRSSSFMRKIAISSPPRTPRTGEAEAFKATFMEYHPATSTFMPLPSPAVSIRSLSMPGHGLERGTSTDHHRASSIGDTGDRFSGVSWAGSSSGTLESRGVVSGSRGSASGPPTDFSSSPGTCPSDLSSEMDRRFGLGGHHLSDQGASAGNH